MPIRVPEDAHRLFAEAFNEGDVEALVALYEPEAVLMNSKGEPARGHEAIRAALRAFLASRAKMRLVTAYAVVSGDIALLRSNWEMSGTGRDGQPRHTAHSSSEVVRRQADGTWLYVVDHPFGADSGL